jgi:hypothetical protein
MKNVLRPAFIKAIVSYALSLLKSLGKSSEFHYFPFDIHKPLPVGAAALMNQLCGVLEEIGVHYRITDGTVLGLYRNMAFIPHDNDIDIDVLDCREADEVHRRMRAAGMHLGRRVYDHDKVQQLTYYSDDQIIFDIVFWYTVDDRIVNYEEPGYVREQPASYFVTLDSLTWNGRSYPAPSQLEDWLALRYGNDWNIPKQSKGDWKQECLDLTKL